MNDGSELPGGGVPPSRPHDLVGTVLAGRYRIVRRLGEGAMGAVYVGEHLRIGRLDAIKVLRGGLATDADSISRFNRGARNLSAIRHPNVCTLYDYGETEDGSPFLALEMIDGESLKEIIDREGALPVPRALAITRQIAAALGAAHHAGIVHRDLKPANVMIERGRDGSDIVKVVDFDIAKGPAGQSGDEVTELGFVVGTPEYMSPEQLMGERLDGRSDLYSLGLVLFRLVSGALPFRGGSTQEIMLQRLTAEPLPLEQIRAGLSAPPGLQAILDRSLARERDNRYPDAADFSADIDRLTAGQAPAAPPAAARGTGGREMPETVVASSTRESVAAATGGASKRGWVVGAIAVLAISAAATPFLLRGRRGDVPEPVPGPIVVDSATSPTDSSHLVTPPDTQTRQGGRKPPATPADTTTPEPEPPPPQPQPQPSGGIVVAAADARGKVADNLDLLMINEESTSVAVLNAVRDTASAVYELVEVPADVRASAAGLVSIAYQYLRDRAACVLWANRALELNPEGKGYELQLTNCGRIGS